MTTKIYLNHTSLAKPSPHLIQKMKHFQEQWPYAADTPYSVIEKELSLFTQETLDLLYSSLGANNKDYFLFTSSGHRAIAHIYINSTIEFLPKKKHILTIDSADLLPPSTEKLLKKLGCVQKRVALNEDGQVNPENLKKALSPHTGLFSISWANGYTGIVQPIQKLAKICHEHGVLVHVDTSHIMGKCPFTFENLPVDYLTFEGSFLHAPKGSGGLLVKQNIEFEALDVETVTDLQGHMTNLMGLAIACEELKQSCEFHCLEIARLRDLLEKGIQSALPTTKVLFQGGNRLPNVCVIVFPGISSELLSFHLKESGVMAFFCEADHTLEGLLIASGITPLEAKSAISFILSRDNTEKQIQCAIKAIVDCAQTCQTFSKGVIK